MEHKKYILDATCGGRCIWHSENKQHPSTIYVDKRKVNKGAFQNNWNPNWEINPDIICDFTNLPFPNNYFKLVIFDPPHITHGSSKGVINIKYGKLNKDAWQRDILQGFNECWRVLDIHGTLIFKWSETQISKNKILDILPIKPLFGHLTGKSGKTLWATFFKHNYEKN